MDDLGKRREVYGVCGECNEPGTGKEWCQPCNAKRFKKNFKNWSSGNKDIDELIQHYTKCLEWVPYENFILTEEALVTFIQLTVLDTFAIGILKIKIGREFLKRSH
jgi:hypothetical protein